MPSDSKHWDEIFSVKPEPSHGWYEDDVSQTMKFVDNIGLSSESTVFLPGVGTSLLVDELMESGCKIIVNDISHSALKKLEERVGKDRLEYMHHNIATPFKNDIKADIWIDRAVLHFLLSEEEISCYFENLMSSVKPSGYVLLAEFSNNGAKKCAGLELHQYSIEEMQTRLGDNFELVSSEEHLYMNPLNQPRPYIYGFFKRIK
mgnify:FL=1